VKVDTISCLRTRRDAQNPEDGHLKQLPRVIEYSDRERKTTGINTIIYRKHRDATADHRHPVNTQG